MMFDLPSLGVMLILNAPVALALLLARDLARRLFPPPGV